MSAFLSSVASAYQVVRQQAGAHPPVARVALADGSFVFFNGLRVTPLPPAADQFMLSGDPTTYPTIVVRDAHVVFVEFSETAGAGRMGFAPA